MQAITGVVRNGRLELNDPITLPNGTAVEVMVMPKTIVSPKSDEQGKSSYRDFILSMAGSFGDEPFERPDQGEFEKREEW